MFWRFGCSAVSSRTVWTALSQTRTAEWPCPHPPPPLSTAGSPEMNRLSTWPENVIAHAHTERHLDLSLSFCLSLLPPSFSLSSRLRNRCWPEGMCTSVFLCVLTCVCVCVCTCMLVWFSYRDSIFAWLLLSIRYLSSLTSAQSSLPRRKPNVTEEEESWNDAWFHLISTQNDHRSSTATVNFQTFTAVPSLLRPLVARRSKEAEVLAQKKTSVMSWQIKEILMPSPISSRNRTYITASSNPHSFTRLISSSQWHKHYVPLSLHPLYFFHSLIFCLIGRSFPVIQPTTGNGAGIGRAPYKPWLVWWMIVEGSVAL